MGIRVTGSVDGMAEVVREGVGQQCRTETGKFQERDFFFMCYTALNWMSAWIWDQIATYWYFTGDP